jgi:hypothetical protein
MTSVSIRPLKSGRYTILVTMVMGFIESWLYKNQNFPSAAAAACVPISSGPVIVLEL